MHVRNPFHHPRSTQPSFNTSATGAEGSGGKVNLQRVDATRDFSRIEAGREGISRVAGDRSYSVTHNLHVRNMKPAASSTKWSGQRGPPLEGSGRSLSRWPSLSLCKITCGRAIRVPCFIGSRLSSRSSLFPARSTIFRRVLREKRRERERGGNGGGRMVERRGIKGMDKWREGRRRVSTRGWKFKQWENKEVLGRYFFPIVTVVPIPHRGDCFIRVSEARSLWWKWIFYL